MIDGIIENLLAGFITMMLTYILKKMYAAMKKKNSAHPTMPRRYKKGVVKNQFFVCLVALPLTVIVACTLDSALSVVKFFLFMAAGYAFILLWGAFDAAFSFYPSDDSFEIPSNEESNGATDKSFVE